MHVIAPFLEFCSATMAWSVCMTLDECRIVDRWTDRLFDDDEEKSELVASLSPISKCLGFFTARRFTYRNACVSGPVPVR